MANDEVKEGCDGGWETVKSKKTQKRANAARKREMDEQSRRERDLRYLRTHPGFQRNRMTRNKAMRLISEKRPEGTLFLQSHGRCVGHLIAATHNSQMCVECDAGIDKTGEHCCCSEDVKTNLPPNFYLGCDGLLDDYLVLMQDASETVNYR